MRDFKIEFSEKGAKLNLFQSVTGGELLSQKVGVNLSTIKGSDTLFPDRGSTMLKEATAGLLFSRSKIRTSAIIAGTDTILFLNKFPGNNLTSCNIELNEQKSIMNQRYIFDVFANSREKTLKPVTLAV